MGRITDALVKMRAAREERAMAHTKWDACTDLYRHPELQELSVNLKAMIDQGLLDAPGAAKILESHMASLNSPVVMSGSAGIGSQAAQGPPRMQDPAGYMASNLGVGPWAFEANPESFRTGLSPAGMLWLRLYGGSWHKSADVNVEKHQDAIFAMPGLAIMKVVRNFDAAERTIITVVLAKGKLVAIDDDANLFPSDTLIVKLNALKD